VEPLQEQDESEDSRYSETGGEEPTRLTQGIHQEDAHKHRDRTREGDGVVGADADESGNFELAKAEADQSEGAVEGDETPQAAELTPAGEVALGFGSPEEQQGVSQAVGRAGDGDGEEVSAF